MIWQFRLVGDNMGINTLIQSDIYKTIESDVESFVKEMLAGYKPQCTSSKTIRDSVWGSVEYSLWEMEIIDSPIFQRLRNISQVGLAFLTYPASRHTRFEHSLGVVAAAKKMCEKLSNNQVDDFKFKDEYKNKVYLAALLHDIGHCFYSHLSETIYGEFEDFRKLITAFNTELNRKPKPHEILAFVIINTKTFKIFFNNFISYPKDNYNVDNLFRDVGKMIIGAYIKKDNVILSCLTSIINGPFDADKLDYIKRDSLTTGLSLSYDVERLLTKILVYTNQGEDGKIEYCLVVHFNGITALEELTFCKIMLYSYIYYHQKVLTSELMIKDYIHGLYDIKVLNTYSDFLRHNDSSIINAIDSAFKLEEQEPKPFPEYGSLDLKTLAHNIKNRYLPKRCFELSYTNVENPEQEEATSDMIKKQCQLIIKKCSDPKIQNEDLIKEASILTSIITREKYVPLDSIINEFIELTYEELLEKRKAFYLALIDEYKKVGKLVNFKLFDIYISFPKYVNYGSSTDKIVLGKDRSGLLTINDFIKLDDWAASFNSNKWRAYIFVSDQIDKNIAFEVAQNFILKGAKIKNPSAYIKDIIID